jgi:L-aminopeptidase/D-esterase-like protein
MKTLISLIVIAASMVGLSPPILADDKAKGTTTRARDLGVRFDGTPGPLNAITDVAGVEVGHVTLIEGDGKLIVGKGPIRTGVTAIMPRGKTSTVPVFGAWFALNASGEMTGTTWLEERGLVDGPIMITNTHSVGVVRDASVSWMVDKGWEAAWHAPVVAETYDGALNDINGFHVTKHHALAAMAKAKTGPVTEGVVGGGTGMICNGFKGGIGTSSRTFTLKGAEYTVGVLVQCNYNWTRGPLRIDGKPVGKMMKADPNCYTDNTIDVNDDFFPYCEVLKKKASLPDYAPEYARDGSIIIVVATDAPLLPHQLKRVIKRPSLALGRLGTVSNAGSGDIFIAFSTAGAGVLGENELTQVTMFPNNHLATVFKATVEATEEAIVNAMVAAKTTVGINGLKIVELPEDELKAIFAKE